MATEFTNVTITQLEPYALPNAKVSITFNVAGLLPDVVQVLAQEAGSQGANPINAVLVGTVNMAPPNPEGNTIVDLQAGSAFTIWLCPRDQTDGVPDDVYDDGPWYDACRKAGDITTQVPQVPAGDHSKPVITKVDAQPATLKGNNTITVSWVSSPYDKFIIWWTIYAQSLAQGEVDGKTTTWTTNQPLSPGAEYTFRVEGGTSGGFTGYNYFGWGPTVTVKAVANLRSLAQLLRHSGMNPAGVSVRSLMGAETSLKKVMKLA